MLTYISGAIKFDVTNKYYNWIEMHAYMTKYENADPYCEFMNAMMMLYYHNCYCSWW